VNAVQFGHGKRYSDSWHYAIWEYGSIASCNYGCSGDVTIDEGTSFGYSTLYEGSFYYQVNFNKAFLVTKIVLQKRNDDYFDWVAYQGIKITYGDRYGKRTMDYQNFEVIPTG
jgi:hypothetical protein